MRAPARPAAALVAGAAVAAALLLSACTGGHPAATSTPPQPTDTASASAPASPTPTAAPTLVPGGTAQQNLAFFDKVNRATIAAKPGALGRDFIDGLVAAGFTKSDMQLTPDTTTIGLKAPSVQFSVQFGDSCVIGQYGPDSGEYLGLTTATLATGGCLIGQTRPIDW